MGRRAQVQAFLRSETVGGALLIVAALIGIICANSPLKEAFHGLATTVVGIDSLHLTLTVEEWAADGLLTIFFFIIGCELKYELVVGSLSKPRQALLPVAAAIGGMLLPALIYLGINSAVATGNVRGWGIPMATDIAFALAVLAVLGRGLPAGARIFLLTMAIVDDLGAILVIALFYSNSVAVDWLIVAALLCVLFAFAQRMRLTSPLIYIPLVLGAWYATHSSGVHATIAGVVLGLLMRARTDSGESEAPVVRIMHRLHPLSAAVAVPAFALFAAAVDLHSVNIGETLTSPIMLGALLGLVIGKPFGIFLAARAAAAVGATLAPGVRWIDIAIVGTVGGIGFTMSLLISELAFVGAADLGAAKLGVLAASLLAVAGSTMLLTVRSKQSSSQ